MKTIFSLIISLFLTSKNFCQNTKISFASELVPYARIEGKKADGSQVGLEYAFSKKFSIKLAYGIRKQIYQLTLPIPIVIIGGDTMPLAEIKVEETLLTPDEKLNGLVFNPYTVDTYRQLGFKHFEPKDGYRQQNYLSLEMLRKIDFNEKSNVKVGVGGTLGIFNRTEFTGALNSKVSYAGEEHETWINYRMTLRYLYYGVAGRLEFKRNITDHFSIGIGAGTHLVMSRKFSISERDLMVHYFSFIGSFLF